MSKTEAREIDWVLADIAVDTEYFKKYFDTMTDTDKKHMLNRLQKVLLDNIESWEVVDDANLRINEFHFDDDEAA